MSDSILDDLEEVAAKLAKSLLDRGLGRGQKYCATIEVPMRVIMACHADSRLKINTRTVRHGEWLNNELIVNLGYTSVKFNGVPDEKDTPCSG